MKVIFMYVGSGILCGIVFFGILFGMRYVNQVASPVTTFHPEQDITCVQVSSTDGVALSCVVKP